MVQEPAQDEAASELLSLDIGTKSIEVRCSLSLSLILIIGFL